MRTDELPNIYSSHDILVVPSLYEPFGLVVAEGMSSGMAVIASNVGGIPEFLQHNETGILCPPSNVEALTQGLLRLIYDPALRSRLGTNARKYALDHLDWEKCAMNSLAVFNEAIETH